MPSRLTTFGLCSLALTIPYAVQSLRAAPEPSPQQAAFFEKQIRPIFENNCFACHSHKSGKSKGHLVVDSLGSLLKGGDSGPAVVPGQPDKSLLLKAVGYQDEELRMPPKGKLPAEHIAALRQWIAMGAPWPGKPDKTTRTPG